MAPYDLVLMDWKMRGISGVQAVRRLRESHEASALPRLIGWGKAVELVLTGDHLSAAEAYRIGYLQRLVPAAELDDAVERWIESLLRCGPKAVRIQKRLILGGNIRRILQPILAAKGMV